MSAQILIQGRLSGTRIFCSPLPPTATTEHLKRGFGGWRSLGEVLPRALLADLQLPSLLLGSSAEGASS